ncbi:MAG TPA: RNA polymerase sigma factor [Pseudomonadales bacterium]|nr:RNA polymerase sigma factor [Pseudomonadales bacterium]
MTNGPALNRFLAEVEQRAFRMARFAVADTDEALDIVQDAMLTLAAKYSHKTEAEWPPLFFRILRNRITDFHRRRTIQRGIFALFGSRPAADDEPDPLEQLSDGRHAEPDFRAQIDVTTRRLEAAVAALPTRQREAFLLRVWEGFDVATTARAMRCSEGSVKTHYSRAVHALRDQLEDDWP